MSTLFLRMAATACIVSALLAVLLFPLRSWLERRYAPQVRFQLWMRLAAILVLGAFLSGWSARPRTTVTLPVREVRVPAVELENLFTTHTPEPAAPSVPFPAAPQGSEAPPAPVEREPLASPARRTAPWTALAGALWLSGAALVLIVQLARYVLARRRLLRASIPTDAWAEEARALGARAEIRVLPGLANPVTMGHFHPVVFLPEDTLAPSAVRHELTHVLRCDLGCRGFLLLTCALYWFDPLVWHMARVAGWDMEAACDAEVAAHMTAAEKRAYGELLLSAAEDARPLPLSTRFGGSKAQMKARLTQLFRPGKTSDVLAGAVVVAALLAMSVTAVRSAAAPAEPSAPETEPGVAVTVPSAAAPMEAPADPTGPETGTPGRQWTLPEDAPEGKTVYRACDLPVTEDGETLTLTVSCRAVASGYGTWQYGVGSIEVRAGGELLQTLSVREARAAAREAEGLYPDAVEDWTLCLEEDCLPELIDLNFDGCPDLRLPEFFGNVNGRYLHWLWDRESCRFAYAFCLTGYSFRIDPEARQLVTESREGWGQYVRNLYAYDGNGVLYRVSSEFFVPGAAPPPAAEAEPEARAAYQAILDDLRLRRLLPNGEEIPDWLEPATSTWSIFDADDDGREELVLCYGGSCVADMQGFVIGWDGGSTRIQLYDFPAFEFYSNGAVKVLASHNQSLGGETVWPYTLYRYLPERDSYEQVGFVDSWDKATRPTGYDGEPYPDAIDRSGSGTVYYVNGWAYGNEADPLDATDYQAWLDQYLQGAVQIYGTWYELTVEPGGSEPPLG